MQDELQSLRKLDERKWKEKRKRIYLSSKLLKRKIRGGEIVSVIGEIFMENCYESDINDIYKTGNLKKIDE